MSVRNVTSIPEVPSDLSDHHSLRRLLTALRDHAHGQLQAQKVSVQPITNLQVIPIAGGARVAFTPSNAASYLVFHGTSPDISKAYTVNIGVAVAWTDSVGQGAVAKWYWVQAINLDGTSAAPIGPKTATTLALGVGTVLPAPPPVTDEYGQSPDYYRSKYGDQNKY